MRSNNTQLRKFEPARPKRPDLKKNRKKLSSNLSTNYSMMLQLYYLNKKRASAKKEVKFTYSTSGSVARTKSSVSLFTAIAHFFTDNFSYFKKTRPEIALVTE